MRALVISGGASKIAFGIGAATELQKNHAYDLYVGISAGSIISLFASIGKLDSLYNAILTLRLKDIFSVQPTNKSGGISFLGKLRLLFGKNSIAKNSRFKKKLCSMFEEAEFNKIKNGVKTVVVGATNFTYKRIDYTELNEQNYVDAMEWVFVSSNVPCVGEPSKINGSWYFDGGVSDYIGISEAIKRGATEIDVILHSPMGMTTTEADLAWEPTSVLAIAKRTVEIMYESIECHNLLLGKIIQKNLAIKINFYYPENILTDDVYNFDENKLKEWYTNGVNTVLNAKNQPPTN